MKKILVFGVFVISMQISCGKFLGNDATGKSAQEKDLDKQSVNVEKQSASKSVVENSEESENLSVDTNTTHSNQIVFHRAGSSTGSVPSPTGFNVIVNGAQCAVSLVGLSPNCANVPLNVKDAIADAVSTCGEIAMVAAGKVVINGGEAKEITFERIRKDCIKSTFSKAIDQAYDVPLGMCSPVQDALVKCTSAFANTIGYSFNTIWCQTYPNDCANGVSTLR